MRGLRTRESTAFISYFKLFQEKAAETGAVYFVESGDGRDFLTADMEGEDLQGWLIPFDKADEFERIWLLNKENDDWVDFFCWAEWEENNGRITVNFHKYETVAEIRS